MGVFEKTVVWNGAGGWNVWEDGKGAIWIQQG